MAEFRLPKNSQITDGVTHKALADATNVKTFKIYRWSPDDDSQPRIDSFEIDLRSISKESIRGCESSSGDQR